MSKIFFLQPLRNPINFEWVNDLLNADNGNAYGDIFHTSDNQIHIRLDPADHSIRKGLPSHQEALLATFTHELLHGYFLSLCCDGAEYPDDEEQDCHRNGAIAVSKNHGDGHDFGWFLVACQIDLCVERLLKIRIHTFSFRSLMRDVRAGGKVSAGDWKLFFDLFSWSDTAKLFGHLSSTDQGLLERMSWLAMLEKDPNIMQVWENHV